MAKFMKEVPENFKVIKEKDPEFFKLVMQDMDKVFEKGALDTKYKVLIALAINAVRGQSGAVSHLSRMAKEFGATKEELAETLRVAYFEGGMFGLATGAYAFVG